MLQSKFGVWGIRMHERANGTDTSPVDPSSVEEFKSIGNSTTLPKDVTNVPELRKVLINLADSVGRRIRTKQVYAGNIQLTIRYSDWKTITRSSKLPFPINTHGEIFEAAWSLWNKHWTGEPVRLLGISAMDLVEKGHAYKQLDLFNYKVDEKEEKLSSVVDQLKNKFGENIVLKGVQASGGKDRSDQLRDKKKRGTSLEKDFLRDGLFNKEE